MASIWKRKGCKSWRITYTNEFGSLVEVNSECTDKKLAQQVAARLEREVQEIKSGLKPARIKDKQVGLAVEEFLADCRRRGLARHTLRCRESFLLAGSFLDSFEMVSELTSGRLTQAISQVAVEKNLSGSSVNSYLDILSAFLSWCVTQDYLVDNPIEKVGRSKLVTKVNPKRPFTEWELKKFLWALPTSQVPVVKVACLSGLRRLELSLLERRDFDLEEKVWHLRPEATKGKRSEDIAMLDECVELLKPYAKLGLTEKPFTWVMGTQRFDKYLRRAFIRKVDDAGRSISFHSCRLTFCYNLATKTDLSVIEVKELMRHKSIQMTVDVYTQLGLGHMFKAVRSMPRLNLF